MLRVYLQYGVRPTFLKGGKGVRQYLARYCGDSVPSDAIPWTGQYPRSEQGDSMIQAADTTSGK